LVVFSFANFHQGFDGPHYVLLMLSFRFFSFFLLLGSTAHVLAFLAIADFDRLVPLGSLCSLLFAFPPIDHPCCSPLLRPRDIRLLFYSFSLPFFIFGLSPFELHFVDLRGPGIAFIQQSYPQSFFCKENFNCLLLLKVRSFSVCASG